MSTEVTLIKVKPGSEEDFIRVFEARVADIIHDAGATGIKLYRSQVNPSQFVKISEWESRDARLQDFVASPLYKEFVALVANYLDGAPSLDDYDLVTADR